MSSLLPQLASNAEFAELGQEAVPRLGFELVVLGQFALDLELFDVIDRVHILHAVSDNPAHLLNPPLTVFPWTFFP